MTSSDPFRTAEGALGPSAFARLVADTRRLDRTRIYGLRDAGRVGESRWASQPQARFYTAEEFPLWPLAAGDLARSIQRFLESLGRGPVRDSVQRLLGRQCCSLQSVNYTRMRRGDFLDWHSDQLAGRVACCVLYLEEPCRGGLLHFRRRGQVPRPVAPVPNRLVAFWPDAGYDHAVTPVQGEQYRSALTAWWTS